MGKMADELRTALYRYKHLLRGGEIDVDAAVLVEDVEEELMEEIRGDRVAAEILEAEPLDRALSILASRGVIDRLASKASERLGEEINDIDAAVEAFLTGNVETPGFRTIFIVIQALARVKAEITEEKEGTKYHPEPVCPVCGATSRTMIREDGNTYSMVCAFCGYKWIVSREGFLCPFCGNRDKLSLGVFTGKKTKRLGLAWCQACGATWHLVLDKTIRVPRLLLPVIAHGAEIYRPAQEGAAQSAERSSRPDGA